MGARGSRSVRPSIAGRRCTRAITALVILAALLIGSPASTGAEPGVGSAAWPPLGATVFGTEGVRLRTCPSLDCEAIAVAKLGERLTVTGPSENGFSPVDYGGAIGFAYDLYLAKDGQPIPSLVEGQPGCKRIALIFNVGIGERPILEILDDLARQNVPATVFAMGWWAAENPGALRQIAADGFAIGSHGDQRRELTGLTDAEVVAEVTRAAATIEAVLGVPPDPWFTPYANEVDDRVRRLVGGLGFMPVGWRVPAADFGPKATAESVYGRVMPKIYDGAIVELHLDGPASATSTAVALPWIVQELDAAGYRFVTVPELATPCTSP